jgi:hypothetical protein
VRRAFISEEEGLNHQQSDGKPSRDTDPEGHTKIENTVRYLGVEIEDALELADRDLR